MRALLVIADIGGYTRFMRVHRINLAHAQYIVAQLLEALIDAGEPYLQLAKLEGDAAFFYAKLPDRPKDDELATFSRRVAELRRGFLARRMELETHRVCTCDGCTQAGQLKLKFVAHVGEVALQKIKRYTELAGVDVIFVHRLLKNSVPVPEYVLMSEPVFAHLEEDLRGHARQTREELEGLGAVTTHYVDFVELARDFAEPLASSRLRRIWGWLKMTVRSLPYFLGIRRSCDGFRNMGEVDPSLARDGPSSTSALASFQTTPPPIDPKS
jgi:hypothetical protein